MDHFKSFLSVERFGSLDGLRALSILGVLWEHSSLWAGMSAPIATKGFYGVNLFFAISGFLICSLMIRERMKHGAISLRAFYIRRSLRIFPLYYAMLLVYALAVFLMEKGPEGQAFFENLPAFLTYTSNWFVEAGQDERVIFVFAWSLAAEEQFYLTWPWIEKYASPRGRTIALGALITLVLATQFGLLLWLLPQGTLTHTIVWSIPTSIVLGVATAHLTHTRKGFEFAYSVLGYRWSAPMMLCLLIVTLNFTDFPLIAYFCIAGLVLSCTLREDNGLARLLRWKPMVRIGVVSYGFYLMHMLAFNFGARLGSIAGVANPWVIWLIGCLLAYAAAEVSFSTFERFFLSMKHKLANSAVAQQGRNGSTDAWEPEEARALATVPVPSKPRVEIDQR